MVNDLLLFFRTVRVLRPKQVIYRLYYKFFYKCFGDFFTPRYVDVNDVDFPHNYSFKIIQKRFNDEFTLLNETHIVNVLSKGWKVKASTLWLYNLHYFDYLAYENKVDGEKLIENWIQNNRDLNSLPWEPYVISLRVVNWIKFCLKHEINNAVVNSSIELQVKVLLSRLEYHILGNHLLSNSKSLIFAGCYLNSDIGIKALNKGFHIFKIELDEQFLLDGGHFELSPMYNNIMLFDLLDIYNITKSGNTKFNNADFLSKLESVISKSITWSEYMTHRDGDVSFFNDSTSGISPKLIELKEYASLVGIMPAELAVSPFTYLLPSSGYFIADTNLYKLLADFAQIGPKYLPGHAHADNLSFELDVGNSRFIVNSGISKYGLSRERELQRNTAAHNTVVVNQLSSSEMWKGFRVARRAHTSIEQIKLDDMASEITGFHNGYRLINKGLIHRRTFKTFIDTIQIIDFVSNPLVNCESNYHFHPDVRITSVNNDTLNLSICNFSVCITFEGATSLYIVDSTYHPGFGLSLDSKKLIVQFKSNLLTKLTFTSLQ